MSSVRYFYPLWRKKNELSILPDRMTFLMFLLELLVMLTCTLIVSPW